MFLRREKITILRRLGGFFWPSIGWLRSTKYLAHRMARLPGSAHSICAGLACGAAISFTPFVGLHIVLAALLALVLRANVIASAVGTVVGNPWTFPFIWVWIYELGRWMGADGAARNPANLDFAGLFSKILHAFLRMDLGYLFESAWPVFWPMVAGSVPTAIVVWFACYFALKRVVEGYQHRRHRRRRRGEARRKMTAEKVEP